MHTVQCLIIPCKKTKRLSYVSGSAFSEEISAQEGRYILACSFSGQTNVTKLQSVFLSLFHVYNRKHVAGKTGDDGYAGIFLVLTGWLYLNVEGVTVC